MSTARPFRIWSYDRSVKKGIIASSLDELRKKGKEKVGLLPEEPVQVVLEEDGTEIDDDDYFLFLPQNTTLMLLARDQRWAVEGKEGRSGQDEPDFMTSNEGQEISERTVELITGLQRDITRLIAFSNNDLQGVIDLSVPALASLLHDTESFAEAVQEACQRHLDERTQTSEAMDLLRLYHTSRQKSNLIIGEDSSSKRPKFANI
ncbi:DNA fragmentation factor subunit alpha-like [Mizuhopecten yessoensis]|uniref:DNAation factor subunit alpha n=1 Tax=Mizuhopecten yessoensis TaxID=6573 RepID=A0A210PXQ4_MIZYE|nr:DNA fragmentation factor subunit alpha-like [Mizuhopecten yessoensis]OWF41252.1 DNA fragmentation factor subunit alpha [Mizuhopecten yessoensis]